MATLYRTYQEKQTIGRFCFEGYELFSMELPDLNNKVRQSCIPEGVYFCEPRYSKRFGNHFHVKDVPNRSYILIHVMNYVWDGLGCIGVGMDQKDINGDGLLDITSSKKAMSILLEKFPNGFELEIVKDEQ